MTIAVLVLSLALAALLLRHAQLLRMLKELRDAIRNSQPIHMPTPGLESLTTSINDLLTETSTLRRQHRDQLTQLEATLGNLREAVLILDESNYIHLANRAVREIFPATRNLGNLRLELFIRQAAFLEYVQNIRAGKPLPRQEFELTEGEETRWIEVSGAQIQSPDGKSTWALFVIHDMTSQRRLERVRRDFVANASHELRTPLSIIHGYVETLVEGHRTMPVEDREKFLLTIQRHGQRLNALIADLLALSRLESTNPGLQFEAVDVPEFLRALADDLKRRPDAEGHELSLELSAQTGLVHGDPHKLTQVITNLVDNAFKYTPPGARVQITTRPAETGEVEIIIADNGPGIPAADLPNIFERFYRVEKGRSREKGGTGLGLSIVKHIVQLHQGRVWAESQPGQGCQFFIRLPRNLP